MYVITGNEHLERIDLC